MRACVDARSVGSREHRFEKISWPQPELRASCLVRPQYFSAKEGSFAARKKRFSVERAT